MNIISWSYICISNRQPGALSQLLFFNFDFVVNSHQQPRENLGRKLTMDVASIIYYFKESASVAILVLATLLVSMVMFVSAKHLLVSCTRVVMHMTTYRLTFVFLCGYKSVRAGKSYFEKYRLTNHLKPAENSDLQNYHLPIKNGHKLVNDHKRKFKRSQPTHAL